MSGLDVSGIPTPDLSPDPLVVELSAARVKAGLAQYQIAEALGRITLQSRISEWERGKVHPSLASLRMWGQVLGLQLAWVPLAYETAPVADVSAGNGASPTHAPASDPVPVVFGDRADVAPASPWAPCRCGHPWLRHDVEEYRGDGSETCCVEGCSQNGCPGKDVARTLAVAEQTVDMAREAQR